MARESAVRPVRGAFLSGLLLIGLCVLLLVARAEGTGLLKAPGFPAGLPWLNVARPLTLADLRGKVVVLDFWTYGCINCLHVADELKVLERKFGDRLAVVSVHSPKFDNERSLATLRRNILRYDLRHPVVQDEEFALMKAYAAPAWPTLAVIDPAGNYVARLVGERVGERLDHIVETLLARHAGSIDDSPLPLVPEMSYRSRDGLAGPGKVAAGERIVAVSDTLNHRVVISDRDGRVRAVFGGEAGFSDGAADKARFRSPQGLVVDGNRVYVADAGNHAVRRIDLETGTVSTLAGTGRIGRRVRFAPEGDALTLDLRSPWALALDGALLYVAMAGSHQIWCLDLESGRLSVFAGTGREGLDDGPVEQASFSQPSGLALAGRDLFVVDAEASAVRRIELDRGVVTTLVGTGLFDFGDRDGDFADAQLQHPGGIAVLGVDSLLVADTYNHKLRRLDTQTHRVTTVAAEARAGLAAVGPLNEPSGVTVSGELILIADTNNDRLVRYDAGTGSLSPWPLSWGDASSGGTAARPR